MLGPRGAEIHAEMTSSGDRELSRRRAGEMAPARVLLVAPSFPPATGGLERLLAGVCDELVRSGVELTVLAQQTVDAREWDRGRPWRTRRTPRLATPLGLLRAACVVAQEGRRGLDCLLVGHWCRVGALLAAVGRVLAQTPFAVIIHGLDIGSTRRRFGVQALRRWSLRHAALLIANSRCTRERLLAVAEADRVIAIHPRIDPSRWLALAERARPARQTWPLGPGPIVLQPGRLVPRKNHAAVIRAMRTVLAEVPDARYVIAGDGPERERLEALAWQLGLLGRSVFFLGEVSDLEMAGLYRDCAVCVMPSRERGEAGDVEGFGIVFLEAGLFGKPVIGGKSGGIPDAIVDGQTGFLVPPDDEEALAERVVQLLANESLARRLGQAGRRRVEAGFCWGQGRNAYADAIREVILTRRGRSRHVSEPDEQPSPATS